MDNWSTTDDSFAVGGAEVGIVPVWHATRTTDAIPIATHLVLIISPVNVERSPRPTFVDSSYYHEAAGRSSVQLPEDWAG
jgi:hypothetical protein